MVREIGHARLGVFRKTEATLRLHEGLYGRYALNHALWESKLTREVEQPDTRREYQGRGAESSS